MIPIALPLIGKEEKAAVLQVLDSGMLAQGKKVQEFEQAFAAFIGVKHAIATSNGTMALHAALLAHNIGTGDEVITTPFSFIATANVICMAGATPVFVDIEEQSFNINPDLIEKAITSRTKAILPVHLYGRPAAMDKIQQISQKYHLVIIEDACQAHGAMFQGKKVGSFGTGCFSFYPTKNMTTGEGGMITTNDDNVAAKARRLITHGSEKKYYHDYLGYNYRLTDIAAAIGLEQLKKLSQFNTKRKTNALFFQEKLQTMSIILPQIVEGHVFHQYTIRVKNREKISAWLAEKGIGSSIFYPLPIHKQKAYAAYNQKSFPVSETMAQEVLSLPVHPGLSPQDLDGVVKALKELS